MAGLKVQHAPLVHLGATSVLFISLALVLTSACSDPASTPAPSPQPTADMANQADMLADAGTNPDQSSAPDLGKDMSPNDDMTVSDMSQQQDMQDMSLTEDMKADPACMYIDLDVVYHKCGEDYRQLRKFEDVDLGAERCPEYYILGQQRFEDAASALASLSCELTCSYAPAMSVSFVHCERRNGYIEWRAAEGCEPIFEFAEGIYPSFDRWKMAHPCL